MEIPVLVFMGLSAGGISWSGTRLNPRWRRGFGITLAVLGLSSFGNVLVYHAGLAASVALGLATEAIGVPLFLAQRRRDRKLRGTNMTEPKALLSNQKYEYNNSPTSLTRFLKTMLWISLGISIISLLSDFKQMNLLSGSFSQAEAEFNDARQHIIGVIFLVASIVTGIAFLKWIYRANSNCRGFGAQGMKFTPGWSIGYYFIPISNLYAPYQAMKEIWKVSTNPADWQNEAGSSLLGLWWALWLSDGFCYQHALRMSLREDTVTSLQTSITASIIDIPLCIVAVSLISAIIAKQEKLVRKNV